MDDDDDSIDFMDQLFDSGCWLQAAYNLPSQGSNSTDLVISQQQEPQKPDSDSQSAVLPTRASVLNTIWISPRVNSGPSTTVRERLMGAIRNFSSLNKDKTVLIQIWVPVRRGVKNYLTTVQQPYLYDPASFSLANYRNVSESYQFSADEGSKEGLGLPGRVFLGKEPEWTPDVRFFRQDEYPRVNHAQLCNIGGSIALPVFEKESGNCLGVVELVTTAQKITYKPEVETVCKALEAVDLRSSQILTTSKQQGGNQPHSAELSELRRVLKFLCDKHGLPLGQTWSADESAGCASTVDIACYVRHQQVAGFHEACCEQQLLKGQGVVGKAFETNEPCYVNDVTAYSKSEYPLSHHAKMFGLRGAVAVRLQCLYGECRSYVLELFLPISGQDPGFALHCKIMESLTIIVDASHSLCFFSTRKLQQEATTSVLDDQPRLEEPSQSDHKNTSWISELVEAQRKGKEVAISFESEPHGAPSFADGLSGLSSASSYPLVVSQTKANEKKKTKAQKEISLQVLRQHFAGSLKEAAKCIGVCPTTLKRICRQHGINRWPSRKIKKVGHSLKKLQLVMDSVQGQGGQGTLPLSSFYSNFPHLSTPTADSIANQQKSNLFSSVGTTSKSTSSSQTSSSSHSLSTGALTLPTAPNACASVETPSSQSLDGLLKAAKSEPDLPVVNNKVPKKENAVCKVKVAYGEEMIRLSLSSSMSLGDLQCEIGKRFRIGVDEMQIKYLDDDKEWVLLTCDEDLEECIDIHTTYGKQKVKMMVQQVSTRVGSSLGSRAQS